MKTLHILVSNKVATYLQRDGYIVCGNSDNQIMFTFDAEWTEHTTKTARFIWNGHYKDVQFSGNICPVPVVANTDKLIVGVYVAGKNLSTTTPAIIPCKLSILCNSNVISEGTVIIPDSAPALMEKVITENGVHYPSDGYDGFYKVTVNVAEKQVIPEGYIKPIGTKEITENGTHNVTEFASVKVAVESEGEVIPNFDTVNDFKVFANSEEEGEITVDYSVSQKVALPSATHTRIAVIEEPNLIKSNIKKDAVIFGIKGEYEGSGGEDIPEISEVDDFTVFAGGADEGSLEIAYSVSQKVALPAANPALLTTLDDENFIVDNIKKGVSVFGLTGAYEGTNSPLPIEVSTEAEMTALLESGEVGGVYKYTGTTGTYENGALYVLEEAVIQGYEITVNFKNILDTDSDDVLQASVNGGEWQTFSYPSPTTLSNVNTIKFGTNTSNTINCLYYDQYYGTKIPLTDVGSGVSPRYQTETITLSNDIAVYYIGDM